MVAEANQISVANYTVPARANPLAGAQQDDLVIRSPRGPCGACVFESCRAVRVVERGPRAKLGGPIEKHVEAAVTDNRVAALGTQAGIVGAREKRRGWINARASIKIQMRHCYSPVEPAHLTGPKTVVPEIP